MSTEQASGVVMDLEFPSHSISQLTWLHAAFDINLPPLKSCCTPPMGYGLVRFRRMTISMAVGTAYWMQGLDGEHLEGVRIFARELSRVLFKIK